LTAALEDDTNGNKEAEKYGNGQAGDATKIVVVNDRGKDDVQERIRCNDSVF